MNDEEQVSFISEVGRQRLEVVARWLEAGAPHVDDKGVVGFDMSVGVRRTDCGTACCIAGAVCQFNRPFRGLKEDDEAGFWSSDPECGVLGRAIDLLDISYFDAEDLFAPDTYDGDDGWSHVTPADAALTIRKYLATGRVDWSHVENKQGEE